MLQAVRKQGEACGSAVLIVWVGLSGRLWAEEGANQVGLGGSLVWTSCEVNKPK